MHRYPEMKILKFALQIQSHCLLPKPCLQTPDLQKLSAFAATLIGSYRNTVAGKKCVVREHTHWPTRFAVLLLHQTCMNQSKTAMS